MGDFMNTIKLTMGEKIEDLIKLHNIDASTLALKTGISKATISDMIRDVEKGYDYRYFLKIARYFNVSTDYLLGLTDAPTTDKDEQYICDYTGISLSNVKSLNFIKNIYCKNDTADIGFIDFLNMLIDRITANDTLLFDFDDARNNKTVYTIIAEDVIEQGIGIDTQEQLEKLESLKYTTNGLSYEITNAINRVYEMFTLSNCGYSIEQFEELQRELK